MILRRLFSIVHDGLAAFAQNPSLYDTLFGEFLGMAPNELAGIKAAIARAPIRLQHGYPHASITMPCICLILQSESVAQKFIGDAAYLPLGGMGKGQQYEMSCQLMVYSENIDLTAALYELVRAILVVSQHRLAQEGIQSPSYTGTDIAPDGRYMPENIFCRSLGVRAYYTFALPELLEDRLTATLIRGLHRPPGTIRSDAYDSGVTIAAPTLNE